MTLLYLVLRGLRGRPFRSGLISSFVLVLTGFLLAATVILTGMEEGLRTGMERLGAAIIVIPFDAAEEAQQEVLSGRLVKKDSMPAGHVRRILEMEAVERASPQLYLSTISGSPYSAVEELYIVAFDPGTDFSVLPWMKEKLVRPLGIRDTIGGASINRIALSEPILVNGHKLNLVGRLERTGIWMDRALFVTFETARDLTAKKAVPEGVSEDRVTFIAVDLKPGYDAARTALEMMLVAPGIWPVRAPKILTALAAQRAGLIKSLFLALGIIWVLAVVLTGFVFSVIVDERRREIGMLRAAGAGRNFIFRMFFAEGALLAIGGGFAGIMLSTFLLYFTWPRLIAALEIQALFPSTAGLVIFTMGSFLLALVLVLPALLYPAVRASRLDPAEAMRGI